MFLWHTGDNRFIWNWPRRVWSSFSDICPTRCLEKFNNNGTMQRVAPDPSIFEYWGLHWKEHIEQIRSVQKYFSWISETEVHPGKERVDSRRPDKQLSTSKVFHRQSWRQSDTKLLWWSNLFWITFIWKLWCVHPRSQVFHFDLYAGCCGNYMEGTFGEWNTKPLLSNVDDWSQGTRHGSRPLHQWWNIWFSGESHHWTDNICLIIGLCQPEYNWEIIL